MISPPLLKAGDKVGIISPAGKVNETKILQAVKYLNEWGLEVILGENALGSFHQFSGTDRERTNDLQKMLNDPGIKAIFSSRGGYGTMRLMDLIDFTAFNKSPKWIVGFSDITALHVYLNGLLNMESVHGPMPSTFPDIENESLNSLKEILFKGTISYKLPYDKLNRPGITNAPLVGGNLSILYALSGSRFDLVTNGKILFIEDVGEYLYHLDRMMMNLKLSGKLSDLKGLLVGGISEMKDNEVPFGKNANEIIYEYVENFDFPVAFNFPAGHIDTNLGLIFGRNISFVVNKDGGVIRF